MSLKTSAAHFIIDEKNASIECHGRWTISSIDALNKAFRKLRHQNLKITHVDGAGINGLDSAGALMLNDLLRILQLDAKLVVVSGLKERYSLLYEAISKRLAETKTMKMPARRNVFYQLGRWMFSKINQLLSFLAFTGELTVLMIKGLFLPYRLPWRDLLGVMDETGSKALGIIALMSFLIGVVLAYQLAVQLRQYGANIFIVDTTGIAILREFAPLITAVIMAGRTSTAFAALIGTMIVNEEVDALRTMGIQPLQRLVLPRIFALIITLPLLVVWADIFGIFGSMVMAKMSLGIGYIAYLERFEYAVAMKHYILGLIKTPIFALVISGVGCFQGFSVKLSAESVGQQTTKAAVQSIFLIIIVDAMFSIVYSILGV